MKITTSVAVFFTLANLSFAQLEWKILHNGNSSIAPRARRDAGLGFDSSRKRLILFGGRTTQKEILDDSWIYELTTNKWRQVETVLKPAARFSFVSGFSNGYFYVSVGEGRSRRFFDDIWRFSMSTEKWELLPTQVKPDYIDDQDWRVKSASSVKPSKRYGSAGGIFTNSSTMYVSLGFAGVRYADTFSYSVLDKAWYKDDTDRLPYGPGYPHARCLHSGTLIGKDKLVIHGGCLTGGQSGGPCPASDSWIFDGQRKEWTELNRCASPRMYGSMAMLPPRSGEVRVVMFGGNENSKQVITFTPYPAEEVAILNPDVKIWTLKKTQGAIPTKRTSAAMITGDDGIYMFGGMHVDGGKEYLNELYLLQGDSMDADKAPQSRDCDQTFFNFIMLHGILMVLGWGFFIQWGAFIARYLRHKDPLWFNLHRLFQIFGLLCAIAGLICAILSSTLEHFKFGHAIVGLVVMILGILQPINAFVRPHKPDLGEQRTVRRALWEFLHIMSGRAALILALINISLGVFLALSTVLIWSLWFAYLGFLVFVYIIAELFKSNKEKSDLEQLKAKLSGDKHIGNHFHHAAYDNHALDYEESSRL